MDLYNEHENLRTANHRLQEENARLRQGESGEVIVVRKSIVPKDYESNKKRLAMLEKEIEDLKYVLSFSGIQSLDILIEDLENDLLLKFKRIVDEFQNFPVGAVERKLIMNTITHFKEHIKALESLLK